MVLFPYIRNQSTACYRVAVLALVSSACNINSYAATEMVLIPYNKEPEPKADKDIVSVDSLVHSFVCLLRHGNEVS